MGALQFFLPKYICNNIFSFLSDNAVTLVAIKKVDSQTSFSAFPRRKLTSLTLLIMPITFELFGCIRVSVCYILPTGAARYIPYSESFSPECMTTEVATISGELL